jgi:hypothetical protein
MWKIKKATELSVLNETIRRFTIDAIKG